MKTKFAAPTSRDLRFERVETAAMKRVDFVVDDIKFATTVTDGAAIVICLLALVALLGLMS
jgi:hypothetical protein